MNGDAQDANVAIDITIKNFGPVQSGKVQVKPLTVFMGSNNTGKSCVAMLIYSILSDNHHSMHEINGKIMRRLRNMDASPTGPACFDLQYDAGDICKKITKELQRNLAAETSSLVSFEQERCDLRISSRMLQAAITLHADKPEEYKTTGSWNTRVTVDYSDSHSPIAIDDNNDITVSAGLLTDPSPLSKMFECCHAMAPSVYYLPATRQGTLQSRKLLSALLARYASYAGIGEFRVPKLPGSTASLLEDLLTLPPEYGPCFKIAWNLEKNMLHGKIRIEDSESFPEINYHHGGHILPLHRTSSMVTAVAPLVLYIKHLVKPGTVFIIEEPEANLHPRHQITLAQCLVDLVRSGVYVLISTHSPYLVEQIGNYLQAGSVSDKTKLPDGNNRYVKHDELAVYSFEHELDASVITKVDTSYIDGIDQHQFVDAFEIISRHARTIEGL